MEKVLCKVGSHWAAHVFRWPKFNLNRLKISGCRFLPLCMYSYLQDSVSCSSSRRWGLGWTNSGAFYIITMAFLSTLGSLHEPMSHEICWLLAAYQNISSRVVSTESWKMLRWVRILSRSGPYYSDQARMEEERDRIQNLIYKREVLRKKLGKVEQAIAFQEQVFAFQGN